MDECIHIASAACTLSLRLSWHQDSFYRKSWITQREEGWRVVASLSSTVVISVRFCLSEETSAPFPIALFPCVPSKPCRETGTVQ